MTPFGFSTVFPISILLLMSVTDDHHQEAAPSTFDCGPCSLYTLLRLEEKPLDLAAIGPVLPPRRVEGHSMKDIQDAARKLNLALVAVRLDKVDRAIDRPAIIFLKRASHGHFVVIKPIGHTGKLVQIIDPNRLPEVIDKDDLFASPEWTGLVLVPKRPNWWARILAVLVGLAALGMIGLWLRGMRRFKIPSSKLQIPDQKVSMS